MLNRKLFKEKCKVFKPASIATVTVPVPTLNYLSGNGNSYCCAPQSTVHFKSFNCFLFCFVLFLFFVMLWFCFLGELRPSLVAFHMGTSVIQASWYCTKHGENIQEAQRPFFYCNAHFIREMNCSRWVMNVTLCFKQKLKTSELNTTAMGRANKLWQ